MCGGGEHHENQLNVFPFPPQKLIYCNSRKHYRFTEMEGLLICLTPLCLPLSCRTQIYAFKKKHNNNCRSRSVGICQS